MRRLTARDMIATVVVAATVVPYVGYLINGSMPFIEDPRGMAGVGLVGLILSFVAWGVGLRTSFGKALLAGGFASLAVGFAALLIGTEGNDTLLAVFIGTIVVLWAAETAVRAGVVHRTL
jgi:hypothetical protein